MKKLVLLFVLLSFAAFSFAQEPNAGELVEKANAAIESKDYAKAIELFEAVLEIPDNGQDEANINKVLNQLKPLLAKANAKDALDNNEYEKAIEIYKALMAEFQDDASIAETGGIMFYNEGITNYKNKDFVNAVKCFTISEKQFNYEKSKKYKLASLKKVAEGLAADGKTSVQEVSLCDENKNLLQESLANVYVSEGNDFYKKGAAILTAANEKVNSGSLKTTDEAYLAEVEKAQEQFKAAMEVLEKAKELDPSNENAQKLIDACSAVL